MARLALVFSEKSSQSLKIFQTLSSSTKCWLKFEPKALDASGECYLIRKRNRNSWAHEWITV